MMQDSGFDSDNKILNNDNKIDQTEVPDVRIATPGASALKNKNKPTELKKTIERQREAARKSNPDVVDSQPKNKGPLMSRSRLVVPTKYELSMSDPDRQPLVELDTDDSEEEFSLRPSSRLSKVAQSEISQQLLKDGYNLDLEPDDEDLDLIPPRPVNERCICCNTQINLCTVQ